MSMAMAKIHARLIYKGKETIDDIAPENQAIVREAYKIIYGTDLP